MPEEGIVSRPLPAAVGPQWSGLRRRGHPRPSMAEDAPEVLAQRVGLQGVGPEVDVTVRPDQVGRGPGGGVGALKVPPRVHQRGAGVAPGPGSSGATIT